MNKIMKKKKSQMNGKKPMIQVKELESGYGKVKVLNGINLKVDQGDLVAIIGPNGSGKSTAIKTIFGLIKPYRGSVSFNGRDITGLRANEIARMGLAYVPQGRIVFETMTVKENLEMGGFIINDKNLVKERIKDVYKFFPILQEKRKQKATFLSGGQQQMLSIGRSLMLKPEVLMLDEPSLGLAPNLMMEIFTKIKQLNKNGMTIILVEQNASMALKIANKALVLEDGRIALSGGKNILKHKRIKDIYFGGR
jgi:branched-chain amino acid transport system ATP-binding protein